MLPDPSLRPAGPEPAGRGAFDTERPDLDQRTPDGLVVWGPLPSVPPLVRMIGERIMKGAEIAPREKAPAPKRRAKNRALAKKADKTSRLARAYAGGFAPVRRNAA